MKNLDNLYKKFLIFLICISLIISYTPAIAFAADQNNDETNITNQVTTIEIVYDKPYLDFYNSQTLSAYVYPYDATMKDVIWTSSDNTLVTVSETGKVTAKGKAGKVTIRATAKDGSEVYDEIDLEISDNKYIPAGEIITVEASTIYKDVVWDIEDEGIFSVESQGYTYLSYLTNPYNQYIKLKALKSGTTNISMKTTNGAEVLANRTVNTYSPITSFACDKSSLTIENGSTDHLNITTEPKDVDETLKDYVFNSSNTDIITVDEKGVISAVDNGSAIVTVQAKVGTAFLDIPVNVVTYAESIDLNVSEVELDKDKNYFDIEYTVQPNNVTNSNIAFKSSDENVAVVNEEGRIYAVGNGETTITVTTGDNKVSSEIKVIVKDYISTESLNILENEIVVTTEGKVPSYKVNYEVQPLEAANKSVVFKISDTSIANVSEDGIITPVSSGETVLTVSTIDGRYKDTVPVKVIPGYNDVTYYVIDFTTPGHPTMNSPKFEMTERVYWGDTIKLYDELEYSNSTGHYIEGYYRQFSIYTGFKDEILNDYIANGDGNKHNIYLKEGKKTIGTLSIQDNYEIWGSYTKLRMHLISDTKDAVYDDITFSSSNENVLAGGSAYDNNGGIYTVDIDIIGPGTTTLTFTSDSGVSVSKEITILEMDKYDVSYISGGYKVLTEEKPVLKVKYYNTEYITISCDSDINDKQQFYLLSKCTSVSNQWNCEKIVLNNGIYKFKVVPGRTYQFTCLIDEHLNDKTAGYSDVVTYKHTIPVPTFTVTNTNHTTNVIKISGNRTDYSNIYVYRSTYSNKNFVKVGTIQEGKSSFTNTKLTTGKTYYYKVKGVANGYTVTSATSKAIGKKVLPATPKSLSVSTSGSTSTKVKWAKVSGVTGYKIYRATSKTGTYKLIKTISKGSTVNYTNSKLTSNKTYYYKIRSYVKKSGKYYYSSYSTPVSVLTAPKTPTFKLTRNSYDSVKITVSKVSGAAGYTIYRAASKKGTYAKIATLSKSGTYIDTKRTTGKTYYYKVKAYNSKSSYSTLSGYKYIKVIPSTPSTTLYNKVAKQVAVSWKNINGATGYQIYRATSKNGKYSKVATKSSKYEPNWIDKKVSKGKRYYYKIRAYVKKGSTYTYSNYSTIKSIVVK